MNTYVENELPSDLVRRLFLSFVKKAKSAPLALNVSAIGQNAGMGGGGGLFTQSSNTITGAIHSLGSRFNFSSLAGTVTGSTSATAKPAPSQSVPEGTKLLCTVSVCEIVGKLPL